jgi:triacylglycerol esterase/lipase EstA (alpha/beta hydrolase family)
VHDTLQKALQETGSDKVVLVGHSAGGWLARAYLSDAKYGTPASQVRSCPFSFSVFSIFFGSSSAVLLALSSPYLW